MKSRTHNQTTDGRASEASLEDGLEIRIALPQQLAGVPEDALQGIVDGLGLYVREAIAAERDRLIVEGTSRGSTPPIGLLA